MKIISHNLRKSAIHARNPLPGWRTACIALALALGIGSAGRVPPVQAAPVREGVAFHMDIVNPKTTVCVGKTVKYEARVYMVFHPPLITPKGAAIEKNAISGIKVEAFSKDATVGEIVGLKKGTLTRVTGGDELVSLVTREEVPNAAVFAFTGKKAGKTILYFEGLAYGAYVSFNVPVNVIHCKYKVTIVTKWNAGMTIVATSTGEMVADENGSYHGSADVIWVTSVLCGIKSPVAPSKAELTGANNDTGQLLLTITFGPARSAGGGKCLVGVSTENFGTPDPLTLMVDPRGVFRKTEAVTAVNGKFPGSATISVIPLPQ